MTAIQPEPEPAAEWREPMAEAYLSGTLEPAPGTAEDEAFAEMDAYARAETARVAALREADAAWAAEHAAEPEPEAKAGLWTGPGWDTPLDTGPEAEAEWADEWDSADSAAYQARVEAGLEPEIEP